LWIHPGVSSWQLAALQHRSASVVGVTVRRQLVLGVQSSTTQRGRPPRPAPHRHVVHASRLYSCPPAYVTLPWTHTTPRGAAAGAASDVTAPYVISVASSDVIVARRELLPPPREVTRRVELARISRPPELELHSQTELFRIDFRRQCRTSELKLRIWLWSNRRPCFHTLNRPLEIYLVRSI